MAASAKIFSLFRLTDEVSDWNKAVDAKKKLKLENQGRTK